MLISLFYFISGEEPYHGCTDIKPLLLLLLLLLKRLNSASVSENNLRIKTTVELVNTGFKLLSDNFALNTKIR